VSRSSRRESVAEANRSQDIAEQPIGCIPVARIRPEEGLGRRRDRLGHEELQRSIRQFGVLTPITVRPAPDASDEYLLIKGQGRTLACRLLGIKMIPAIVLDEAAADDEKVQQFLVENVARLKMRPVDRALLIHRARQEGEETAAISARFGVSASTVRRLLAQLEGAGIAEVNALRRGSVNLAMQHVISRHVSASEREAVVGLLAEAPLRPADAEGLFVALGWRGMIDNSPKVRRQRLLLLAWAITAMSKTPKSSVRQRVALVARQMPAAFEGTGNGERLVVG
jgi:ParB/RepB/Spo0J family partition protein